MRTTSYLANLAGIALCAAGALADEIATPAAGSAATSPTNTPSRGATMGKVEAAFGAPTQRAPAVGLPPITRWDYPGFVVFFENDRVIHSVVR